MNVRFTALCLAVGLALAWSGTGGAAPSGVVKVAHVYDGDTVRLEDGTRVRLAGIDTPERDPEQYWARRSSDRLRQLLQNEGMRVTISPVSEDRYKRLVAELYTRTGESLNERMLREGMAYYYPHKELSPELSARLLAAQKKALNSRAGCWKGLLERRESRQVYTGNRSSLRIFSRDCREGVYIASYNRVTFRSLEEAFEAGYAPARSCNIWPLARDMERRR